MNSFPAKKTNNMGYQKSPSMSSSSYKGVGGSGGGSRGFISYGGSQASSSSNYKKNGASVSYGGSKGVNFGGVGGSQASSSNNYNKNIASGCYGGSKGVEFGEAGGSDKEKKITPISELDPMLDGICIQARCISKWNSHRMNAEHDPYSLDLVLQDVHNTRIQVYIKKEFMFRFEPLFEVGQCYILGNFGIAENSGRLPLLPHRYKISVYRSTTVTRIEPFDNNFNGFIFEPFDRLLDTEHHQYYKNDAVDVIGSVVGIGDVIPVMSAAGKKIRRTVVIEDSDANCLDFTFWDGWASMWDQYANKRETLEHLVVILQLAKVKYWNGTPAIHNALFGTKIFTNPNMAEIVAFRKRVQEREGFNGEQVKIELISPEVNVVSVGEFFHGAMKRMVGTIRDCEPDSHCIVYAKIHKIHKEHGWAYTACKRCNKKVDILPRQNRQPVYVCEDHGNVQVASRFKVILRIIDETGSAPVLFFNNNFVKISGNTAWELMEKHGMDPDEYWPKELDAIIGKSYLFKIFYSEYNMRNNNHTYRCDSFSEDVDLINHFKKNFLEHELDNEEPTDHLHATVKNSSGKRPFAMSTPSQAGESTNSKEGSSCKKSRVIIDLDEIESETEEECNNSRPYKLLAVKIEPKD